MIWIVCQKLVLYPERKFNFDFYFQIIASPLIDWASQMAQKVKNLPAMQEMLERWVWFLGWEEPLEEGTATHSSIFACRILWTKEPGGLQS